MQPPEQPAVVSKSYANLTHKTQYVTPCTVLYTGTCRRRVLKLTPPLLGMMLVVSSCRAQRAQLQYLPTSWSCLPHGLSQATHGYLYIAVSAMIGTCRGEASCSQTNANPNPPPYSSALCLPDSLISPAATPSPPESPIDSSSAPSEVMLSTASPRHLLTARAPPSHGLLVLLLQL